MIARLIVALQNWAGLDGYVRVHVDDIANMRQEVARLREGIERSAAAGRTSKNVAAMASLACRRLDATLSYIEPISQFDAESAA